MPIYNDISLLHPEMIGPCKRLHDYLIDAYETGRTQTRFEVFETFRDPMRQKELIAKNVSKAGPFKSAHQLGLACDFVPYLSQAEAAALGVRPGWSWHEIHEWKFLADAANRFGLGVPILWDRAHVEHPLHVRLRKAGL